MTLLPRLTRDTRCGITLVELLNVVVVVAIVSAVSISLYEDSVSDARQAALATNLARMRGAISYYRVQHDETWPGQSGWEELVRHLVHASHADGSPGGSLGPYLRDGVPLNPFTGTNDGRVVTEMPDAPDGSEAWLYCRTTGELRANVSGVGGGGSALFGF